MQSQYSVLAPVTDIFIHCDVRTYAACLFFRPARPSKTKHKKEGSTRLPKFPAVQMPTGDLASKPLNYGDVPQLRYCVAVLYFALNFELLRILHTYIHESDVYAALNFECIRSFSCETVAIGPYSYFKSRHFFRA